MYICTYQSTDTPTTRGLLQSTKIEGVQPKVAVKQLEP